VPEIDRIILEQAIADLRRWQSRGVPVGRVSVNVSARRLRDEELISGLGKLAIQPGTISFELVESIFLDEKDELIAWNVDRIKEFGIDIEIDDFGTGYASIVSLQKLKPRRLKIDRQLVMPVVRSPAQRQLIRSITDIGRSLGIEIIAEGVETTRHAQVLASLGCQALQGFALAKPMSRPDFEAFVRESAWRKAS
jgi:EAL domain-containing protein (putative c-di-GMP-specific phosphodiesterase class I)